MTLMRNSAKVAVVGLTVALTAAACGGGSSSKTSTGGASGSADTKGVKGGTINVLNVSDFEHLDPARTYVVDALNFSRMLYRTLTTYKAVPGPSGNDVVGDLATDTGTPSNNGKTWKFTLRSGLKYEDGTPIKAEDIKYGVERSFDPDLPEGPQYMAQFLADVPTGYKGPKKSGTALPSIVVAGNSITFKLKRPVGDFSYTVALPTTAPVPQAKDTGIQYDNRPFSSGPYKIESYKRGKSLTLSRNTFWNKKSDPVRNAYPDKVVCTFGLDPATIDQRLIADSAQDQTAIDFDSVLAPESIPATQSNPAVKSRTISGPTPFLRYVAINMKKVPNLKVRQAINYAMNKETYRTARGGKFAGAYGTTILPPTLKSYQKFDLYPAPPQGDPFKAKKLLQESGVPIPLKLTLATSATSKGVATAVAVQAALKRADIQVNIQQLAQDIYYTTVGDTAKEPELVTAAWGADWPAASTVIPPLFDGRQIKPQGNQVFSLLNDPKINAEMDRINGITDPAKQGPEWAKLDKTIMEQAPIVPILYDSAIQLHGSKVKGGYLHAFFGQFDMVSLSVAK